MKTDVYLKKSKKSGKKFTVFVNGKTVHFGASGMSDYTKHKDPERMKRYIARHKRGGENWKKSGITTAGFWSRWLLWNKPSLGASKKDIAHRFNVVFKSGDPKKSIRKSKRTSRKRKSKRTSRKRKSKHKSKRTSRKRKSVSRYKNYPII